MRFNGFVDGSFKLKFWVKVFTMNMKYEYEYEGSFEYIPSSMSITFHKRKSCYKAKSYDKTDNYT